MDTGQFLVVRSIPDPDDETVGQALLKLEENGEALRALTGYEKIILWVGETTIHLLTAAELARQPGIYECLTSNSR